MNKFEEDDRVRVDIPNESDIDHDRYHGKHGTIISVLRDDAGEFSDDEEDSLLYRVEFDSGETMDFRRYDLRPPID